MKKWVKKLRGLALATMLTVALSGKAYAEAEEGQIPETPPQFIAPASETASVNDTAPITAAAEGSRAEGLQDQGEADKTPANGPTVTLDGSSGDSDATISPAADPDENDDDSSLVISASSGEAEMTPASTLDPLSVGNADSALTTDTSVNSDVSPVLTADPDENGDDLVLTVNPNENGDGTMTAAVGLFGISDRNLPSADGTDAVFSNSDAMTGTADGMLAVTNDGQANPDAVRSADGTKSDGTDQNDSDSEVDSPSILELDENVYVLINHDGTEDLQSEGDITVMAAGLNHVHSVSGSGTATVYGTGILLIDYIDDDLKLALKPLEGMGYEGIENGQAVGAAVFLWDEEAESYVLSNKGVLGILDEDYSLDKNNLKNAKGYRFVIPSDEALLLCGTGAEPIYDDDGNITDVHYYHGTNHGYKPTSSENFNNIVEYTCTLTIGNGAELVVESHESKHGSVIIQNLKSLGPILDTHDGCRHPELIISNGGTLTLEGSFGTVCGEQWWYEGDEEHRRSAGTVTIQPGATLTGDGYIRDISEIRFMDPEAVKDCDVMLNADHFYLNGSGTYTDLEIANSVIHLGQDTTLSGVEILDTTGTTCIVLRGGETLDIARVEGINVSLRILSDDPVTVTGNMEGIGFITFDSGTFIFADGMAKNDVTFYYGGAIICDYAGVLKEEDENLAMFHVNPDEMSPAHDNGDMIPVSGAYMTEHYEKGKASYFDINQLGDDTSIQALYDENLILPNYDNGSGLKELIGAYKTQFGLDSVTDGMLIHVQILRMNEDGTISFDNYRMNSDGTYSLEGDYAEEHKKSELNAHNAIAVRILFYSATSYVEPATPATHTSTTFTGSGILGGYKPGSSDNGNGNGNGDNGNGNGNGSTDGSSDDIEDDKEHESSAAVLTDGTPNASFWVEQKTDAGHFELHASDGAETLREFGGQVTVVMHFDPPKKAASKTYYAVFRNADGTTAIRASYSLLKSELRFEADRLGEFIIVAFDFDGVEFSYEFYKALAQLEELKGF